jgi:hypothetical protein
MRAYLSKKKITSWFMENKPGEFLLAKLKHGEKIDDDTRYDVSWIDSYDGREVFVDRRDNLTLRISETRDTRLGRGYESIVSLVVVQPSKDAWIDWREE